LSDDAEHLVNSSLFVLGKYRQDSTQCPSGWSGDGLGGLLVEVRNVEGVFEHLAELAVVDAAVRTAIKADDPFAVLRHELCLVADGQFERGQKLAFGDAAATQSIVVLEELGRSDPRTVHCHLTQHARHMKPTSDVSSRTWPRPLGASRIKSSGLGLKHKVFDNITR